MYVWVCNVWENRKHTLHEKALNLHKIICLNGLSDIPYQWRGNVVLNTRKERMRIEQAECLFVRNNFSICARAWLWSYAARLAQRVTWAGTMELDTHILYRYTHCVHKTHSYHIFICIYIYTYGQTAHCSRKSENDGGKKWGKKAVKHRLFIYTQL